LRVQILPLPISNTLNFLMKKQTINVKDMTRDQKLALIDDLLDRDVAMWKQYVRDSDSGLSEFLGRRNDRMILRPIQK